MSTMPEVGKLFDNRYQIIRKIAEGGMGAVYQATDNHTNQFVAIKFILPDKAGNKDALERFKKEAEALKRLQHPHIVKFHRFIVRNNFTYIVLDYLTGQTLQEKLNSGYRFPVTEAIRITQQLGDALEYAHQKGIIHRDLKPSNIMLTEQGQAILMDFGIVKIEGTDPLTASGAMIGSVAYVSSEQAKGDKLDYRTDIYSLGTVLYQMLTGRIPFSGKNEAVVLIKILNEAPPDMRYFVPTLPQTLVDMVAKAMHKDKTQRYRSAAAFVQALSHLDSDHVTTIPIPIHRKTPTESLPSPVRQRHVTPWLLLSAFSLPIVISLVIAFSLLWNTSSPQNDFPTPVIPTITTITTTQVSPTKINSATLPVVDSSDETIDKELLNVTPNSPDATTNRSEPTLIPTYTNTPTPAIRHVPTTATATSPSFGTPDIPAHTSTSVPPSDTSTPVPPIKATAIPTTPPPIYDTPTPRSETSKN